MVFNTTVFIVTNLQLIGHMPVKKNVFMNIFVTSSNLPLFFLSFQLGGSALNSGALRVFGPVGLPEILPLHTIVPSFPFFC